MIAVVVSSQNRCYYCLTAHGAAVRTYSGDPALGETDGDELSRREADQEAARDARFRVKMTNESWAIEERTATRCAARLYRSRHLGHRGGGGLLQHVEPRRERDRHAPERGLSRAGTVRHALGASSHAMGQITFARAAWLRRRTSDAGFLLASARTTARSDTDQGGDLEDNVGRRDAAVIAMTATLRADATRQRRHYGEIPRRGDRDFRAQQAPGEHDARSAPNAPGLCPRRDLSGSTAFDLKLDGLSWMEYIASRGYDVYLLDLRGYGKSTRPKEMSEDARSNPPIVRNDTAIKDIGTVVDFVLARRNIPRVNLLGWSWGTALMAGYTAQNNSKVERLVLYAPVWIRQDAVAGCNPARARRRPIGRLARDQALARWMTGVPGGTRNRR
jgi:hypothetical protein